MAQSLWNHFKQQLKANAWVRKGLRSLLSFHNATRPLKDFPLHLQFPSAQHFNLFFSRAIAYEPDSVQHLARYIKPGDVCFDIGANIGIYSIIMAHLVGPTGEVRAFEPDPQNWPWIEKNAAQNNLSQISVHKYAVGEVEGKTTLYQDTSTSRTSSLVEGVWAPDRNKLEHVEVDVLPLDQFLQTTPKLNFLKMDVETFEYEALCGAKQLLQTHHPILLLELSDRHRESTSALLEELGYTPQEPKAAGDAMVLFLHASHTSL